MKKKIIYFFLDKIVGDGVECVILTMRGRNKLYRIKSYSGYIILDFMVSPNLDKIRLIAGDKLYKMLGYVFSLEDRESINYIRDWFWDKYNLNKVDDIKRFIPLQ